MQKNSLSIDINQNSQYYPYTPKRTFSLTQDDLAATQSEAFFAIQVNFTGTTAVKICVKSGFANNDVNPVIASYSGQIIPVCGVGLVSSGTDAYGTSHTTDTAVTDVIAFGGNLTENPE